MRMVRSLVGDIDKLEATSHEELKRKLGTANQKVNELLESKMAQYRCKINTTMLKQRERLRKVLTNNVQPLLNMITDDGGRVLNVEFKKEHLELPIVDLESFEAEVARKMQGLVKEKREQVTRTRQESRVKHGACGARHTVYEDVQYQQEETTGFKVSPAHLKQCWSENIDNLIEVSQRSTRILIEQEVFGEIEKIQNEVTKRCDDFIEAMQTQVEQKHTQRSMQEDFSKKLKEDLAKMDETLKGIIQLKAVVGNMKHSSEPDWEHDWEHVDAEAIGCELIDNTHGDVSKNDLSPR